jgi:hypothetical protein
MLAGGAVPGLVDPGAGSSTVLVRHSAESEPPPDSRALGFGEVWDYAAGKIDQFAAGLPIEGEAASEVRRAAGTSTCLRREGGEPMPEPAAFERILVAVGDGWCAAELAASAAALASASDSEVLLLYVSDCSTKYRPSPPGGSFSIANEATAG